MLWKELFVEPGLRPGGVGWACVVLIVLASLVPVVGRYIRSVKSWYSSLSYGLELRTEVLEGFDIWGRLIVTGGACLALLSVAIHAAGSISGERERHTLDSLLTTPLTLREILFSKWLGSILSVRRTWVALLVIWIVCTGVGGMRGVTLLACAAAWVVYAGCFAMMGLWFSVTCRSTRKATLCTLGALALLGMGHWLPRFFVPKPAELKLPHTIAFFGLTPPVALHWLTLHGDDLAEERIHSSSLFERFSIGEYSLRQLMTREAPWRWWERHHCPTTYTNEIHDAIAGTGAGLLFWLGLTAALWLLTLRRFQRMTATGTPDACRQVPRPAPPS